MMALLDHLEGVRETGKDRWLARCPAHDDRSPSLSIRDAGDRLLIHCFGGCHALSVVHAVGLELHDLFEDDPGYRAPAKRLSISPRDALDSLEHESLVVWLIGGDVLERRDIDEATWSRLAAAVQRIGSTRAKCWR